MNISRESNLIEGPAQMALHLKTSSVSAYVGCLKRQAVTPLLNQSERETPLP